MSLTDLINRPCTVTRRTASTDEDKYGNKRQAEANVETVCEVQQRRRDEPDGHGEFSESDWLLFFLPDVELDTGDFVTVDGTEYELLGRPWRARNPRTRTVEHVEATARIAGAAEDSA